MYIWNFDVIVMWSYHNDNDEAEGDGSTSYVVAAPNHIKAIEKMEKVALNKSLAWQDTDEDGKTRKHYQVVVVDIVKMERGDWIDG